MKWRPVCCGEDVVTPSCEYVMKWRPVCCGEDVVTLIIFACSFSRSVNIVAKLPRRKMKNSMPCGWIRRYTLFRH